MHKIMLQIVGYGPKISWQGCIWSRFVDCSQKIEDGELWSGYREIYKQASSVLIWLECESDDSKEALDFISLSQPHVTINYGQYLRKIEAVLRLCNRPYWRRLWIIQEVILARNAMLHCGKNSASWDDFSKFRVRWDQRIGIGFARRHFADVRKNLAFDLDRYRLRPGLATITNFRYR